MLVPSNYCIACHFDALEPLVKWMRPLLHTLDKRNSGTLSLLSQIKHSWEKMSSLFPVVVNGAKRQEKLNWLGSVVSFIFWQRKHLRWLQRWNNIAAMCDFLTTNVSDLFFLFLQVILLDWWTRPWLVTSTVYCRLFSWLQSSVMPCISGSSRVMRKKRPRIFLVNCSASFFSCRCVVEGSGTWALLWKFVILVFEKK